MKVTKSQIKRIIKEELSRVTEAMQEDTYEDEKRVAEVIGAGWASRLRTLRAAQADEFQIEEARVELERSIIDSGVIATISKSITDLFNDVEKEYFSDNYEIEQAEMGTGLGMDLPAGDMSHMQADEERS